MHGAYQTFFLIRVTGAACGANRCNSAPMLQDSRQSAQWTNLGQPLGLINWPVAEPGIRDSEREAGRRSFQSKLVEPLSWDAQDLPDVLKARLRKSIMGVENNVVEAP
jgi:hypothetical protein